MSSRKTGYVYKEGGIGSPDGHCRAFDAQAQGTVGGEGVGIVVLKRLEDALADGDISMLSLKVPLLIMMDFQSWLHSTKDRWSSQGDCTGSCC